MRKPDALIRPASIFFPTLMISLLAGISNLSADVSYTTSSTKGWLRTTDINNLGLASGNTLSGTFLGPGVALQHFLAVLQKIETSSAFRTISGFSSRL